MEHYKIEISKDSIGISSHDKQWVEDKVVEFKNLIEHLKKYHEKSLSHPVSEDTRTSQKKSISSNMPINEFYRKYIHSKIKSRPDIATFFIYYLTKVENKNNVNVSEIKDIFKDVQYPGWNKLNITDILNNAKKKALLNSVGGQWSLTITGEDFILNSISENND